MQNRLEDKARQLIQAKRVDGRKHNCSEMFLGTKWICRRYLDNRKYKL